MKDFDPATTYPDQVRWFGTLMGPRNDSYGASCHRCAKRRLARAKAERDAVEAYRVVHPWTPQERTP